MHGRHAAWSLGVLIAMAGGCAQPSDRTAMKAAGGQKSRDFVPLFNGRNLDGWHGQAHGNPYEAAKLTNDQRTERRRTDDEDMRKHWRVEGGEIIADGQGVDLATDASYGDFELLVDWKLRTREGTGDICLRGFAQIGLFDPSRGLDQSWRGMPPDRESKSCESYKTACRPVGSWNTERLILIGSLLTAQLNGMTIVQDKVAANSWDGSRPIPPTGPIQLRAENGQVSFRNLRVRRIIGEEANRYLLDRDAAGFAPIFNGRDLTGWWAATNDYVARDGVLAARPEAHGTLYSQKQYSDFVLRFEFKVPHGGNNGLGIRAPGKGNPAYQGMELQVLDDSAEPPTTHNYQLHGSIYGAVAPHLGYQRPVGEWNFQEVIACGPRIRINLNGTPILDVDTSRIDRTPDGESHPGLHRTDGYIGWLSHGSAVEFRNIRIKELR